MIKNKNDLKFYLAADKFALNKHRKLPAINDEVWKYEILLRKVEYYLNTPHLFTSKILLKYYQYRKHKLGIKLGFDIPSNVFGAGLRINHFGNIVVNASAKIGRWCDIHQGVNIGTNNSVDGQILTPEIGDNVWIGPGAKLFGKISIGEGVVIGANAVVGKDAPNNVTISGSPSQIIKESGTEVLSVAANKKFMDQFFQKHPEFNGYRAKS